MKKRAVSLITVLAMMVSLIVLPLPVGAEDAILSVEVNVEYLNIEGIDEYSTYTYQAGEPIKPEITVRHLVNYTDDNGNEAEKEFELTEGVDYTITYVNNIYGPKACVVVEGTGNVNETTNAKYVGSRVIWFNITDTPANLQRTVISDEKGEDLTIFYNLDSDGVLTISGYDSMPDYTDEFIAPWLESAAANYREIIKQINIEGGVTYIGANAFSGCVNAESVEIAGSVEEIGANAFLDCNKITDVYYEGSRTKWNNGENMSISATGNSSLTNATIHTVENIADMTIEPNFIPDQEYTGGSVTPQIVVKDGYTVLTERIDYTIEYNNNISGNMAKGRPATVTIMGTNDENNYGTTHARYVGSVTLDFNIYLTVTYDCETNGGQPESWPEDKLVVTDEATVDLTAVTARAWKDGYDFVGWNTNPYAREALTEYCYMAGAALGSTTLYAIFKKDTNVRFYSQNNVLQQQILVTVYNNETSAYIDQYIEPYYYEGWTAVGWKDNTEAKSGTIDLHSNDGLPMTTDVTKDYYALYSREITVSYDIDRVTYGVDSDKITQYFNSAGTLSEAKVTLPDLPDEAEFVAWAIGSKSGERHDPGEEITVSEDTVVYALYESDMPKECTITYDYATNGGKSASKKSDIKTSEEKADLTVTASKEGYEFVGWSTYKDAHEALEEFSPKSDTTLYAIFKKDTKVRFYSKNGIIQKVMPVTVYNNEKWALIGEEDLIEPSPYKDWEPLGWRYDNMATPNIISLRDYENNNRPIIPDVTKDYYAVYSRLISIMYIIDSLDSDTTEGAEESQYFNSAGNSTEAIFTLLTKPDVAAWAIGSKKGEKHYPNEKITVSEDTELYAIKESDIAQYTVTYDAAQNGGKVYGEDNVTQTQVREGTDIIPGNNYYAVKDGYKFLGWNTDKNATEGLEQYIVNGDVTLYAIYKKTVTATFINDNISADLYNNDEFAYITAPEFFPKEGWEPDGWRADEEILSATYKNGTVKISQDTTFYPIYKRFITLSYDAQIFGNSAGSQTVIQYGNDRGDKQEKSFTLLQPSLRNDYDFVGWEVNNVIYSAGKTVTITENTTAHAQWNVKQKPANTFDVVYNYAQNGGSEAAKVLASVQSGENADLSVTASKNGYEFIGWNTDKDAHTALNEYKVKADTVLYAIYEKNITATFYSGENNTIQATKPATLFNNEKTATVTAPEPISVEGWSAQGWRDNKHALESNYESGDIEISANTDFYAVYSRDITVETTNEDGTTSTVSIGQYMNSATGAASRTVMLEEPAPREGYRFRGWKIGDEPTIYKVGTPISVTDSTNLSEVWVKLPEGDVDLPSVDTLDASGKSTSSAILSSDIKSDGGDDIIEQGFVYWSKLGSDAKYTVLTDGAATLSNLSPDTEYYYYAFAENAAGTGKGYIKSFTTLSDDKPNTLLISPEYVSIEKDSSYQLLVTILPKSAKNRSVVWSSSDEKVVTVDKEGKITGVKKGQAIITATTEVGRITAECIVDVTETMPVTEYDFSEWNMATNTSCFAEDGLGFDWDTTNYGGNHQMATAYLARWDGAVLEENDKYPEYNDNPDASYKKVSPDYHVQNIEWIPARENALDNNEIKYALMEYGAVYTLFNIDWQYFDDDFSNYYAPVEVEGGGHCVTIVGWDDNYSKDNFTITPPSNGAFICKNSWGEWVGENGFFYISYYDALMGRIDSNAVVTGIEDSSNYNKIYQYDPLGAVGYIGYGNTTYAANVFPESGNTVIADEELKAVSFYTYNKNTSYDVFIVTDYKDKSSLTNLWTPAATGVIRNSGYHTINLKTPVSVKAGTRFAVVIKLDCPGEDSYVYCEYPVDGYSSNARANSDESYYSSNGKRWYDLTGDVENANFCIKAFTDNGATASSISLFEAIPNTERNYESDKVYTLSEAVEKGLPINEKFIEYTENTVSLMSADENEKSLGSIPGITKAGANSVTFTDGAMFPSKYDLRDMGVVSSVKDQGSWGTCWAHTMYASLESCILKNAKTTKTDTSADTSPTEMTLSRDALTMNVGSTMTLAKKILPINAENKSVLWISSDESVATVDTNGTIRTVGKGAAQVTAATVEGGICAQCSIVSEDEDIPATVTFETNSVKKNVGDVFMVTYSVTPMSADSNDYGWLSDNTMVAAVNENGVITALSEGTANISIISDDGEVKDTVAVIVGSGYNCSIGEIDDSSLILNGNVLSGKVTTTVSYNSSAEQTSTAILGIYGSDNRLLGITTVSKTLESGDNGFEFDIPEINGIENGSYTIKCLVWNSFAGTTPLANASKLEHLSVN